MGVEYVHRNNQYVKIYIKEFTREAVSRQCLLPDIFSSCTENERKRILTKSVLNDLFAAIFREEAFVTCKSIDRHDQERRRATSAYEEAHFFVGNSKKLLLLRDMSSKNERKNKTENSIDTRLEEKTFLSRRTRKSVNHCREILAVTLFSFLRKLVASLHETLS